MISGHPVGALELSMNLSIDQRETLNRWLPTLLAVVVVWFVARRIKRFFWAVFGIGLVMFWAGGRLPFWF